MKKENKKGYSKGTTKAKKQNSRSTLSWLTDKQSPVMAIRHTGLFIY